MTYYVGKSRPRKIPVRVVPGKSETTTWFFPVGGPRQKKKKPVVSWRHATGPSKMYGRRHSSNVCSTYQDGGGKGSRPGGGKRVARYLQGLRGGNSTKRPWGNTRGMGSFEGKRKTRREVSTGPVVLGAGFLGIIGDPGPLAGFTPLSQSPSLLSTMGALQDPRAPRREFPLGEREGVPEISAVYNVSQKKAGVPRREKKQKQENQNFSRGGGTGPDRPIEGWFPATGKISWPVFLIGWGQGPKGRKEANPGGSTTCQVFPGGGPTGNRFREGGATIGFQLTRMGTGIRGGAGAITTGGPLLFFPVFPGLLKKTRRPQRRARGAPGFLVLPQ